MLKEFRDFAMKGNVVDLAVGVIIGAAFGAIVTSMVADIIRSLDRDITVVLIEHDMDLALGLVDFVTCMFEGRVMAEQPPDEIRRNKQVQEVYLGRPRHA